MEPIIVEYNSEKLNGKKIRYINFDNENYLIYTLQEIDDEGYQKLYINKIIDNEEERITDLEWEELKHEIPTIVKEIRSNNMVNLIDLDIGLINNVDMKYSKAFKLKENIVNSIIKQKTSDTIKQIDNDLKSIINDFNDISDNKQPDYNYSENKDQFENINDDKNNIETPINPNTDKINRENEINEEIEKQKKLNEELQSKIIILEEKIKKYEEKLEKIKTMITES